MLTYKAYLMGIICLLLVSVTLHAEATQPSLPTQPPTPTTVYVEHPVTTQQAAAAYLATPPTHAPGGPTPPPTAAPCPAEAGPVLRYDINTVVNLNMHTVRATELVRFRNETGDILDKLVFSVEPNRQPGVFSLIDLQIPGGDGIRAYELTGPELTVFLSEPLGGNCTASLQLDFVLAPLPIPSSGFRGRAGHLGFSQRQFNLGHWFPYLTAYRPNVGWVWHPAYGAGEHFVLPTADFDVTIGVEDADTPQVVGPGVVDKIDDSTWHFTLTGGRDMVFSIGESYDRVGARTTSGLRLEVYFFDEDEGNREAALHALDVGIAALTRYEQLFGPAPFERFVVVNSDFPDGMEFSGLVFVGSEYFYFYNGAPAAWLTLITAHELSHQWWYALVGNDQALDPWLDEALATYSEVLYLEEAYPELVSWWWDFRVTQYHPQGTIGKPIYEYTSWREYINVNYLLGATMLRDLRAAMGDEAFFAWLQAYVAANARRLAVADDLWAALPDGVDREAINRIRANYGLDEEDE